MLSLRFLTGDARSITDLFGLLDMADTMSYGALLSSNQSMALDNGFLLVFSVNSGRCIAYRHDVTDGQGIDHRYAKSS